MTLGLVTYRTLTAGLDPFLPLLLNSRVKKGKENPDRLQERRGYASRKRPAGKLVWMHGASIGESQVLTLLYEALKESAPDLHAVITTQTQTSAELIARKDLPDLVHQMAPVDTPFATERFLKHWQPDLAIVAEGDIWPNMLSKLDKKRIPRMLVNARMTEKSLQGWERYPMLAKKLLGGFEPILPANQRTMDGLRHLTGKRMKLAGNLKYAAPELAADEAELERLRAVIGSRPVFAALSTHPGEEEMVVEAFEEILKELPDALLIIAPRHPERAGDIMPVIGGYPFYHRFQESAPSEGDQIWLCDTLGELGLWMRLANVVFLGGGKPGSGILGHNPIEALKLERYVLSQPETDNFKAEFSDMTAADAAEFISDAQSLAAAALPWLKGERTFEPDTGKLASYLSGDKPLRLAKEAALKHLKIAAAS